ncbi:MAG TPA: hypothetical protein VKP88_00745 [Candidatus Paceibacterota bacterium]|nr:hypothetical protein [Candidatus Paceibacterota bacterium]
MKQILLALTLIGIASCSSPVCEGYRYAVKGTNDSNWSVSAMVCADSIEVVSISHVIAYSDGMRIDVKAEEVRYIDRNIARGKDNAQKKRH